MRTQVIILTLLVTILGVIARDNSVRNEIPNEESDGLSLDRKRRSVLDYDRKRKPKGKTCPKIPKRTWLVLTGGQSGSNDGDILSTSEMLQYFGVCPDPVNGNPGIPDLQVKITAGRSIWMSGRIIFCGGSKSTAQPNQEAQTDCRSLKSGDASWLKIESLNNAREAFTLTVINQKPLQALAIGGINDGTALDTIELLTYPKTDEWKWKTLGIKLKSALSGHCTISIGPRIVIIIGGGSTWEDLSPTTEVWRLNLGNKNNPFKKLEDLPEGLWGHACTKQGGFIYVSGGRTSSGTTENVYKYNIKLNKWTKTGGTLKTARYGHEMGTTANKQIVVAGGKNGNDDVYLDTIEDSYNDGEDWVLRTQTLGVPRQFSGMAKVPAFEFNCN